MLTMVDKPYTIWPRATCDLTSYSAAMLAFFLFFNKPSMFPLLGFCTQCLLPGVEYPTCWHGSFSSFHIGFYSNTTCYHRKGFSDSSTFHFPLPFSALIFFLALIITWKYITCLLYCFYFLLCANPTKLPEGRDFVSFTRSQAPTRKAGT